jgi:protein phosphatase methylesterase 1
MTFASCISEMQKILPKAGFLSLDARGHGQTTMTSHSNPLETENPSLAAAAHAESGSQVELDLSLGTLSRDLLFVIQQTQAKMGWENLPDIVLVGHSLGGAIITDLAKQGGLGNKLLAYAVLDVVEGKPTRNHGPDDLFLTKSTGSALDALQSMEMYLSTRPIRFVSLGSGIEWQYAIVQLA